MIDPTANPIAVDAPPADVTTSLVAASKDEKKYFLAVVREHELSADGREHRVAMLIAASNQEEAETIHREAARHWYSTDEDESPTPGSRFSNPCWDYEQGSFAWHPVRVELQECDEISAADYLVLKRYAVCAWDLTGSDTPEWVRKPSNSEGARVDAEDPGYVILDGGEPICIDDPARDAEPKGALTPEPGMEERLRRILRRIDAMLPDLERALALQRTLRASIAARLEATSGKPAPPPPEPGGRVIPLRQRT